MLVGDGGLALSAELLDGLLVLAKIELGASEHDGSVGAVVGHLRVPLGAHVLERGRVHDRVGDQENVRLRVGEGAQTIVVLLTGSIPKTQVNGLSVHHDVGAVVVKDGGNVLTREGIGGVRDQQAGLSDGSVTNDLVHSRSRNKYTLWSVLIPPSTPAAASTKGYREI